MTEDKLESVKNLIILGNGADLNSGLNSSFSDYMISKSELIEKCKKLYEPYLNHYDQLIGYNENKLETNFDAYMRDFMSIYPIFLDKMDYDETFYMDIINLFKDMFKKGEGIFSKNDDYESINNKINFWDLILLINKKQDNDWYDIEQSIQDNIVPKIKTIHGKEKYIPSFAERIDALIKIINDIKNKNPLSYSITDNASNNLQDVNINEYIFNKNEAITFIIAYSFFDFGKNGNEDFYIFLKEQLRHFELSFKEFLLNLINKNSTYAPSLVSLLKILIRDENSNIFNFNYTKLPYTPYTRMEYESAETEFNSKIKNYKNIHGSILGNYNSIIGNEIENNKFGNNESPIIFGIDSNYDNNIEIASNIKEKIDPFTKTYRLMSKNSDIKVLDPNINQIIFFGHSLGSADYSYFQSIFDYYDIYHEQVELEFIYAIHGENMNNKNEIKLKKQDKQIKKIFRLINNYGSTLNNKDHGRNLLHKLLTEGRIKVKELSDVREENYRINKNKK